MEEGDFSRSSRPFANLVICCTGSSIMPEARAETGKHVEEMGASWKEHLTREVTHMLVGETSTKKYKYVAKQRPDVKVVKASFVEAARDIWINGEEFSLEELEQEHRLPTFFGLKICVTNLQEDDRINVSRLSEENGASFHGDLTKDITHLIVGGIEGKKYKFARNWNIHCVSIKWFYESLERGMALEEEYYNPQLPPEEIGKGAWIRPNLGKRKSGDGDQATSEQPKPMSDIVKRKIRRTASDRLGSQSQHLWGDIIGQVQAPKPPKRDEWEEPTSFIRSIAEESGIVDAPDDSPKTLEGDVSKDHSGVPTSEAAPAKSTSNPHNIFDKIGFFVYGFDNKRSGLLQSLIREQNGECYSSLQGLTYSALPRLIIIIPEFVQSSEIPSTSDLSRAVEVVSYWWLEKCMHVKEFINPADYILAKPFKRIPIPDFKDLTITISLLYGVDFLHVRKAIELLGATWLDKLSQKRSLLIVNSPYNGEKTDKIEAARVWDVPIVSVEWLYECINEGESAPLNQYLVAGSKETGADMRAKPVGESEAKEEQSDKSRKSLFEGCVFYVGSSVKEHEAKLRKIIIPCGGTVAESVNEDLTHFLHTQKKTSTDIFTDAEQASQIKSCEIISPNWLKECYNRRSRVDVNGFKVKPAKPILVDPSISMNSNHLKRVKSNADVAHNDSLLSNNDTDVSVGPFILDEDDSKESHHVNKPTHGTSTAPHEEPAREAVRYESPRKPKQNPYADKEPLIIKPRSFSVSSAQSRSPSISRTKDLTPAPAEPHAISKALEAIKAMRAQSSEKTDGTDAKLKPRSRIQGRALSNNSALSNANANSDSASRTTSISTAFEDEDNSENVREKINPDGTQFDMHIMPSQTLVYADPDAQMQKKKLYELFNFNHEDKRMLGRTISTNTAAVEDMGDPQPTRRRSRRTNH